jgi:hypothetical protein
VSEGSEAGVDRVRGERVRLFGCPGEPEPRGNGGSSGNGGEAEEESAGREGRGFASLGVQGEPEPRGNGGSSWSASEARRGRAEVGRVGK